MAQGVAVMLAMLNSFQRSEENQKNRNLRLYLNRRSEKRSELLSTRQAALQTMGNFVKSFNPEAGNAMEVKEDINRAFSELGKYSDDDMVQGFKVATQTHIMAMNQINVKRKGFINKANAYVGNVREGLFGSGGYTLLDTANDNSLAELDAEQTALFGHTAKIVDTARTAIGAMRVFSDIDKRGEADLGIKADGLENLQISSKRNKAAKLVITDAYNLMRRGFYKESIAMMQRLPFTELQFDESSKTKGRAIIDEHFKSVAEYIKGMDTETAEDLAHAVMTGDTDELVGNQQKMDAYEAILSKQDGGFSNPVAMKAWNTKFGQEVTKANIDITANVGTAVKSLKHLFSTSSDIKYSRVQALLPDPTKITSETPVVLGRIMNDVIERIFKNEGVSDALKDKYKEIYNGILDGTRTGADMYKLLRSSKVNDELGNAAWSEDKEKTQFNAVRAMGLVFDQLDQTNKKFFKKNENLLSFDEQKKIKTKDGVITVGGGDADFPTLNQVAQSITANFEKELGEVAVSISTEEGPKGGIRMTQGEIQQRYDLSPAAALEARQIADRFQQQVNRRKPDGSSLDAPLGLSDIPDLTNKSGEAVKAGDTWTPGFMAEFDD